jgi:hypothetical protein
LQDYLDAGEDSSSSSSSSSSEEDSEEESVEDHAGKKSSKSPAPASAPVPAPIFPEEAIEEVLHDDVVPAPAPAAPAPVPAPAPATVIEKLDTPPAAPILPPPSAHTAVAEVPISPVTLEKLDAPPAAAPQELVVDTEQAVHFTPYDTVFDETKQGVSEIRYAPKISIEDKPPSKWDLDEDEDDVPRLQIGGTASALTGGDIEDLDAPAPAQPSSVSAPATDVAEDVDTDLAASGEFEEL